MCTFQNMKCVVPGRNVKMLSRAIHSLANIGDVMDMEMTRNSLFLIAVNSSR